MVARVNFQEILRHTFDIELRMRLLENLFFSFLSLSMVSPLMRLEEEEILRG